MPREGYLIGLNIGEALAGVMRQRWPRDTAKHAANAWELELETAKNAAKGHASERTITKAVKAEGWELLEALGHAMTGQTYAQWQENKLNEIIKEAELARENISRLRARGESLAERATELEHLRAGPLPSPRRHARG